MYTWHWEQIPQYYPLIAAAAARTVQISLVSIVLGSVLGGAAGLCRVQPFRPLRFVAASYVELLRNIPLMLVLYLIYFGAGAFLPVSPFWASVVGLSVFEGAYVAEIVRAGIESIDRGQMEAARSLGMTYLQSMRHVIVPQAVRRTLPPLTGQFVSLIKDSSLASLVSYEELMLVGRQINSRIFSPFEVFLTIGAIYFSICLALSLLSRWQESRLVRS
ncbi:MAG: amino acid ABC transporter permease [Candidatus Latescibacteria bacterium]|nr:amino acid ABC transporter permease [Candidatus Latescibacterota bacterium]